MHTCTRASSRKMMCKSCEACPPGSVLFFSASKMSLRSNTSLSSTITWEQAVHTTRTVQAKVKTGTHSRFIARESHASLTEFTLLLSVNTLFLLFGLWSCLCVCVFDRKSCLVSGLFLTVKHRATVITINVLFYATFLQIGAHSP